MPEKRWKPGGSQNGKPGGGKFETVYTTQEYDKNAKEEYWRGHNDALKEFATQVPQVSPILPYDPKPDRTVIWLAGLLILAIIAAGVLQ